MQDATSPYGLGNTASPINAVEETHILTIPHFRGTVFEGELPLRLLKAGLTRSRHRRRVIPQ